MLKFVMVWAEKIDGKKSDTEVAAEFPNCIRRYNECATFKYKTAKAADAVAYGHRINNDCFVGTKRDSRLLSFLRHLRNSIAHGNIKGKGKYYSFSDYIDNSQNRQTAMGKIKKETIHSIMHIFLN